MMKKFLITLSVVMLFVGVLTSAPIKANEPLSIPDKFDELQEKIDGKLTLNKNGIYEFDEIDIKNLVYSFDVDEMNDYYGTNYTKLSLSEKMISEIRNYKKSEVPVSSTTCNLRSCVGINRVEKYWNYRKYYCDQKATYVWIDEQNRQADLGDVLGLIVPGGGVLFYVNGKYCEALAAALKSKCTCRGTITEINTFTSVFSVVSQ